MPRARRATAEAQPIGQAAQAVVDAPEPGPNGDAAAFQLPACITERQLKAVLRSDDEYKGQIDGLTGERRAVISNATERQHLHKDAYAMLKRLRKCRTAEQKALLFYTLLEYVKLSGELRIIEAVPTLPMDEVRPSAEVVQMPQREAAE